jgi:hypothetical protein
MEWKKLEKAKAIRSRCRIAGTRMARWCHAILRKYEV